MDFLFQTNIGSYYTSLIFFAVLSIGCAVLTFLIKREGFDDKFFL